MNDAPDPHTGDGGPASGRSALGRSGAPGGLSTGARDPSMDPPILGNDAAPWEDLATPIPWARPFPAQAAAVAGGLTHPSAPAADILLQGVPRSAALADVVFLATWALVAVVVETLLVVLLAWKYGLDLEDSETLKVVLLPGLVCRSVLLLAGIGIMVRLRRQSWSSLGLTARRWAANLLVGGLAVVGIYICLAALILTLYLLDPQLVESMSKNADNLRGLVPKLSPLGFLGLMTVVALYEEVVFRGFLMTRLRRACGSWIVAVLASTLVFTLLHAIDQEWSALPVIAMLSLVFSGVTIWRRSLVPAVAAHLLFNYSQVIGLFYGAPPP